MDLQLFYLFNNLAQKNPILDQVGIFFANWVIFGLVGLALILAARKGKAYLISQVFALIFILLIDRILNLIFPSPRPFIEHESNLLIGRVEGSSFPSTHAAISAAAAIFIFSFFSKMLGTVAIIAAFLVGISRIFVGVHYPSDILAGWVLGIIAYITSVKLMVRLTHHQP